MDSDWLREISRFVTIGRFHPGWFLIKPLLGIVEQDQAGHYFVSNETLGLYAVGFTREEALDEFKSSIIDNYRYLEARAGEDLDLKILFWEYQKYLQRDAPVAV
jgi:hypothetical protein